MSNKNGPYRELLFVRNTAIDRAISRLDIKYKGLTPLLPHDKGKHITQYDMLAVDDLIRNAQNALSENNPMKARSHLRRAFPERFSFNLR